MKVTYEVVEHDGGWAYRANGTFSETFSTREQAAQAASRAAGEQRVSDETHDIEYETAEGEWTTETSEGGDRPETEVKG